MVNKNKNELMLMLAGEEILLRPTFDSLTKTENEIGSIASLAVKMSGEKINSLQIPFSQIIKIFFLNQAQERAPKSLETIYTLCTEEGYSNCFIQLIQFVLLMTAGQKTNENISKEQEKKVLQS